MSSSSVKKPIKIFARLKPLDGDPSPYVIEPIDTDETDNEILILNLKGANSQDESYHGHRSTEIHRFRYSKVFEQDVGQAKVFDRICRPVLDSALTGYNGTVFAYGQTGSGKTFTMTGSRTEYDERGIIPRALSYVFQKYQEREDGTQLQGVYVSYLEIYNENGYDLLNTGFISTAKLEDLRKVILMEDKNQQIHLKNLSVHPVATEDEALHLFYLGEHNRTIAETPMNEASTRSHCIFTVHLNVREACGSVVRRSKVHLVDLAGSERIANSNISGQLFNEARHINLALHYLEQVIVALGESNRTHIPYRNSMMTSILRDSLGGNCMTSMIATLSLESRNMPETLSTCRFSQRVALVSNAATINEEVDSDVLISQLKAEVKRLKTVIGSSSIKPLSENSTQLTCDEINDCWNVVQTYLTDADEQAILAVTPDMRLVQTCFRCLKMACNMSQSKSMMQMMKYTLPDSEAYPQNQKVHELVQTLAYRDAEIQVLTKMLRAEKEKNSKNNFRAISGMDVTASGPFSSRTKSPPDFQNSARVREADSAALNQLNALTDKLKNSPPFSPRENAKPLIDKETLLLEGLSDAKKAALDNFMKSYNGTATLGEARQDLLRSRSQYYELQEDLNKNHYTLNQLNHVIGQSLSPEDQELNHTEVLTEAYKAQKRTMAMKELRLGEVQKSVFKCEENLKSLYGELMADFEDWWINNESQNAVKPGTTPIQDVATGVFKRVSENSTEPSTNSENAIGLSKENREKIQFKSSVPTLKSLGLDEPFLRKSPSWILENNYSSREKSPKTDNNNQRLKTIGDESERETAFVTNPQQEGSTDVENSNKPVYCTEDDQIMKDIPMTGDPDTDKEIVAFFRTREAVFRKINGDKEKLSETRSQQSAPV